MKKKSLSGILAVLMVFALALTGCGQQGFQNAGATGSESQNDTTAVDDGKNEGEVTTEPEKAPDVGEVDNRRPEQDADGNYIYLITVDGVQTEVKTCVNVWDYITDDTPYDRVDFSQISEDLGWERMPAGFGAAKYTRDDGSYALIGGSRSVHDYDLSSGERRLYEQTVICFDANDEGIYNSGSAVSARSVSDEPYIIGKSETYVSLEQIVLYAYMVDYYREGTESLFEINGIAIVP